MAPSASKHECHKRGTCGGGRLRERKEGRGGPIRSGAWKRDRSVTGNGAWGV